MAAAFPLDIVTPERTVLSETVTSVQLPAVDGSMGILAGHAPLLAELGVGECVVRTVTGAEEVYALAGGFVEVSRERVTILADTAQHASEIDIDRAEEALSEARNMLTRLDGTVNTEEVNEAIRKAQSQIRVARGGARNN